jgi:hypothetical protein
MDERELEYEEAIKRLADLFSDDPSAPPSRGRRKYLLEYEDSEPVFHLMGSAIKWAILAGALNVRVIEAAYDSALISEATVPASAKETPSHLDERCEQRLNPLVTIEWKNPTAVTAVWQLFSR